VCRGRLVAIAVRNESTAWLFCLCDAQIAWQDASRRSHRRRLRSHPAYAKRGRVCETDREPTSPIARFAMASRSATTQPSWSAAMYVDLAPRDRDATAGNSARPTGMIESSSPCSCSASPPPPAPTPCRAPGQGRAGCADRLDTDPENGHRCSRTRADGDHHRVSTTFQGPPTLTRAR